MPAFYSKSKLSMVNVVCLFALMTATNQFGDFFLSFNPQLINTCHSQYHALALESNWSTHSCHSHSYSLHCRPISFNFKFEYSNSLLRILPTTKIKIISRLVSAYDFYSRVVMNHKGTSEARECEFVIYPSKWIKIGQATNHEVFCSLCKLWLTLFYDKWRSKRSSEFLSATSRRSCKQTT